MESDASRIASEECSLGYLLSLLHAMGSLRLSSNGRYYYPYSAAVCLLIFLFIVSQVAVVTVESVDVDKITLTMCVGVSVFVTFFKTLNTLYAEESLLVVLDQARKDYAPFVQHEDLPEIVKTCRLLRILSKSYLVFGGVVAALWMLGTALNGERSARTLPFVAYFPFDVTSFPGFEVAYLFHTFIMIYVYILSMTADIIFANCVVQICLQLRIVSRNLSKLNSDASAASDASGMNRAVEEKVYQQLVKCVQHHQIIIRYARLYESTWTNSLLIQTTSLSAIMCFLLYQIVKQAKIVESVSLLGYFSIIMMQTLVLCLFGDMIISDSESILFAAYSSFWLTASPRFKKSINIIMAQGHNPITISAGSFVVLSKETFISILQLTYSFFTVLRSMNAE